MGRLGMAMGGEHPRVLVDAGIRTLACPVLRLLVGDGDSVRNTEVRGVGGLF